MNSLKHILSCSSISFKTYFRSRSMLAWLLLYPILLTTISGSMVFLLDISDDMCVYVQDQSQTQYSQRFIDELENNINVTMINPSENIETYVQAHPDRYVIVIPEELIDWMSHGIYAGEYTINILHEERSFGITVIPDSNVDGNPTIILPDEVTDSVIGSVLKGDSDNAYKNYLATIVSVCIMQIVMSIVISNEVVNRQSNISRISRFTNIKGWEWELSQMLWMIIPVAISSVICYVIMCIFHVVVPSVTGILSIFLFSMCLIPLGLIISRFVSNPQSTALASSVMIIPMVQLSGGIIPLKFMPQFFFIISRFLPMTYSIEGLRASDCLADAVSTLLPLAALCAILSLIWLIMDRCDRRTME